MATPCHEDSSFISSSFILWVFSSVLSRGVRQRGKNILPTTSNKSLLCASVLVALHSAALLLCHPLVGILVSSAGSVQDVPCTGLYLRDRAGWRPRSAYVRPCSIILQGLCPQGTQRFVFLHVQIVCLKVHREKNLSHCFFR